MVDDVGLNTLLDRAEKHIRRVLIEDKERELMPMVVMAKEGELGVAEIPWRNDDEKIAMVEALGAAMREKGIEAYVFMSEAWIALMPCGWSPDQRVPVMPKERPDRKEVVFALACDKDRAVQRSWRIVRGEAGTIVKLEREKDEVSSLGGRMADMLKPGGRGATPGS